MKKVICTAIAVVAVAAFAGPALAGNSSSSDVYKQTSNKVQHAVGAKKTTKKKVAGVSATKPVKTSTLPFTGLDLGFIVGAGVVLIVLGVSLRRLSRTNPLA